MLETFGLRKEPNAVLQARSRLLGSRWPEAKQSPLLMKVLTLGAVLGAVAQSFIVQYCAVLQIKSAAALNSGEHKCHTARFVLASVAIESLTRLGCSSHV